MIAYQTRRARPLNLLLLIFIWQAFSLFQMSANEPDSVYLFAYATDKNDFHEGLHFAWSVDRKIWHSIGPEYSFLRCDYGRWGSVKKMYSPFLFRSPDGCWHCVWGLNEKDGAFAHASSTDLVYWGRQSYPVVMDKKNCLSPEVTYDPATRLYTVSWASGSEGNMRYFAATTRDFKKYGVTTEIESILSGKETAIVSDKIETGTIHAVPWQTIGYLIKEQQLAAYKGRLYAENTKDDPERFSSLKPLDITLRLDMQAPRKISDLLLGVFFEDINYAADGGLYAQLIQNGGFEYDPGDREDRDPTWNSTKAWRLDRPTGLFSIDTVSPIHPNNKHYAVLKITQGGALVNEGFDGIPVKAGEKYDFSAFVRSQEVKKGDLLVRLVDPEGRVIAEAKTKNISSDWGRREAVLVAGKTVRDAKLVIQPRMSGQIDLDGVSLFPQKTFKGRKNGMRQDLAQALADLKPRFVRFPGGCVAHGDGLDNIYHWKNTIGPLETRKPQRNLWGYHQSFGLGYYEYFQFCEDIGAEPVPVLAAGVPCQNSAHHGHALGGQQGGIPLCEMDEYVQDILDLIEYANGDARTVWGRKRAEAGHPAPFNLKYIGIGNEDLITDVFEERFTMILQAVRKRYPEIKVIGTVGPFYEGTDYVEGWNLATKLGVPVVDEHYYNPPGWFIHNPDFYDKYDRSKPKVYLGEYAAHLPGRPSNMETALAEALHLCNVERNGDVVVMTSYAPLLAREGHTQWSPDLIYFNQTEVKPTVGYYVQQLFGRNAGDEYFFSRMELSDDREDVRKRLVQSVVRDSRTGDWVVKMVNLLPVEATMKVDWGTGAKPERKAIRTVLAGTPDDKEVRPVSDTFDMDTDCILPPYSFTVLRMKATDKRVENNSGEGKQANQSYLLVGTSTVDSDSKGIYLYRFNEETGQTDSVSMVAADEPGYQALSPDERFVYSVGRNKAGVSLVYSFALDKQAGKLIMLNEEPTESDNPCYITVDPTGRSVQTANYGGGSLSSFPVNADGTLARSNLLIRFKGAGPDKERQEQSHLHSVRYSPDGKFLFGSDLGTDFLYRLDVAPSPSLSEPAVLESSLRKFATPSGTGPRHFDFHPNGRYFYSLGELSGEVVVYDYNGGDLKIKQTIAADTVGAQGSADVHVSPDGRFLYASNRLKADGIAIFSINPKDGTLTKVGYQPCGKHPRNFVISPNGKFLLLASRDENRIQIFRIDPATGLLTDIRRDILRGKPMCLKFW